MINEITPELADAILTAQMSMEAVHTDSENPHFRSKYASLSAVRAAIIPAFHQQGVSVIQELITETGSARTYLGCFTHLIHKSGAKMTVGPIYSPLTKEDPQGIGSATTYLRRYSLLAVAGLAPEDDDGNSASNQQHQQSQPSQQPAANGGDVVRTGKHKGIPWKEVESGYIRWILEKSGMEHTTAMYQSALNQAQLRDMHSEDGPDAGDDPNHGYTD